VPPRQRRAPAAPARGRRRSRQRRFAQVILTFSKHKAQNVKRKT
jgi:hypothetical protein